MVKIIKIGITGKANSGKDTVAKLLMKLIYDKTYGEYLSDIETNCFMAFADPIKEMAQLSFPKIPKKWLYGASKYRTNIIPGAFKNGTPLTVRQLLIDIGNDFGRKYNNNLWVDNLEYRFRQRIKKECDLLIVSDCRFRNEFDRLKKLGFYQIKLLRNVASKIDDISETNQDGIADNEFDYVLNNNGTLSALKKEVGKIVLRLPKK